PADKGLPSTVSNEGAAKTTSRPEGPHGDKDSEVNKPPTDMEPINPTVSNPLGTGVKYQVDETQSIRLRDELAQGSDEEEVFATGDDMEEENQADEEEHQSPSPNKDKPKPSHTPATQESNSDSSSPDLKKFDNTLPLTERKLIKASIEGVNLLNALNGVTETLKVVQDAVKDDVTLNKKVIEATKAYTKNSSALTELLSLVKDFDFQGLKSLVESLQAAALRQDEYLAS
ncbi:hypothetical protein Tco_0037018, partial [Tanacetum coccineum]